MANACLIAGAALSAVAALLHVGCIVFGAPWYRFFGAGERMARRAAAGHVGPALITFGIATVLGIWSLYALSGAGIVPRLPLLRVGLCAVAAICVLRGIAGCVLAIARPGERRAFWWWSSLACFVVGACYAVGTWQAWPQLSAGAA